MPVASADDVVGAALSGNYAELARILAAAKAAPVVAGPSSGSKRPADSAAPGPLATEVEDRPRKDAPRVLNSARGNKANALASTRDKAAREVAVASLVKDYRAPSGANVMDSYWNTWVLFHERWFGDAPDVLPLTAEGLVAVGAMFKTGHYKAFPNYLSTAKERHISDGHAWTQALDLVGKKISRSVLRGLGGPKQAGFLCPRSVAALDRDAGELVAGGPLFPVLTVLIMTAYFMRELEAACAKWKHISFNEATATVRWLLPASSPTRGHSRSRGPGVVSARLPGLLGPRAPTTTSGTCTSSRRPDLAAWTRACQCSPTRPGSTARRSRWSRRSAWSPPRPGQ